TPEKLKLERLSGQESAKVRGYEFPSRGKKYTIVKVNAWDQERTTSITISIDFQSEGPNGQMGSLHGPTTKRANGLTSWTNNAVEQAVKALEAIQGIPDPVCDTKILNLK
nr:hypothetical protein [Tanacetum cinerariifolium]